ncbi:XTP/dITP diphosphohydrolase [Orenia metallireducens]|uniref:dITP/XTP pyrophosphatase n=1 Tax=Orenia metallireducens TaxID=1413210 RepID=A0A285H9R9_9FIRM|nr:XTP/dITP diphosphatase [Orenia metallireducens]PRX28915.1 XTP/dITP diphosphohydrolase [Orenia metallireducens]SNY32502.1 XTP/dITP diphosphohydrolase [Orenia metallireducens]
MKLFLATGNQHKIEEMKKILADTDIEILSKNDIETMPEVIEDQDTFIGNSLKKAREIAEYIGMATIADDSGLVVQALNGQPGVYSARFAGENATDQENNQKLLELLKDIPLAEREAYFICAMAFVSTEGKEYTVTGKCHGHITFKAQGEEGFGYDPLFIPKGYKKSFAQLGSEVKNKISHRAKALDKMKDYLIK